MERVLRYFLGSFIFLAIFGVLSYFTLFTSMGNRVLKPLIENELRERTHLDLYVQDFTLNQKSVQLLVEIDKKSRIKIYGDISLLKGDMDLKYEASFKELKFSTFSLRDEFESEGTIKGDYTFLQIEGFSDIAESQSDYKIEIDNLKDYSFNVKVREAILEEILYALNLAPIANADVDMDVNIQKRGEKIFGDYNISANHGKVNTQLIRKEFDKEVPRTLFSFAVDANISNRIISNRVLFNSTLASVKAKNLQLNPKTLELESDYELEVQDLRKLYFVTSKDLRGKFSAKGRVHKAKEFNATLTSKVANGVLQVQLENNKLHANFDNGSSLEFLHMLNYPKLI